MTYPRRQQISVPNRIVFKTLYMCPRCPAAVFHYTVRRSYTNRWNAKCTRPSRVPGARRMDGVGRETRGIRPRRVYSREWQGGGKMRVRRWYDDFRYYCYYHHHYCWPKKKRRPTTNPTTLLILRAREKKAYVFSPWRNERILAALAGNITYLYRYYFEHNNIVVALVKVGRLQLDTVFFFVRKTVFPAVFYDRKQKRTAVVCATNTGPTTDFITNMYLRRFRHIIPFYYTHYECLDYFFY